MRSASDSLNVPAFKADDDEDALQAIDCLVDETPASITPDLSSLTDNERHVLLARAAGETLRETGRSLGLSGERARQIETKAREKLGKSKGLVARTCIRDLIKRRGYRKPWGRLAFRSVTYPCRTYSKAEIDACEREEL